MKNKNTNDKITAEGLLAEIKPLLKDCFVAKIRKSEDGLLIVFPNGQRFSVAVWEIQGDFPNFSEG